MRRRGRQTRLVFEELLTLQLGIGSVEEGMREENAVSRNERICPAFRRLFPLR